MKFISRTIIFFIALFLLLFSACESQVSYEDDLEDRTPLQIYLFDRDSNDCTIKKHIESYNIFNDDNKLDIEISSYTIDEAEVMYETILNEMAVGKGPDIIVLNNQIDKYIDISKISKQNAFADMDRLIENSESFDIDLYNKYVIDAGIIDNQRVIMPISFEVEYITAVKESFENNYLDIPDTMTMDTYLETVEDYYSYEQNNPAMLGIDTERLLFSVINEDGRFENDNVTKRVFYVLKEEHSRMDKVVSVRVNEYEDLFANAGYFISNNYLFNLADLTWLHQFEDIHIHYNLAENMFNSHFLWYPSPIGTVGTPFATVDRGFLINNNSKHKNEAFEFIEYALSNSSQGNKLNMTNLPVNLHIYNTKCEDFLKGYDYYVGYPGEGRRYASVYFPNETVLPDEIAIDFLDYVNSAEEFHYLGNIKYLYNNVLYEVIEDYYNNKISFEDLINAMNSKLAIYYTE